MNKTILAAGFVSLLAMSIGYGPSAVANPLGVTRSAAQQQGDLIQQVRRGGGGARMGGGARAGRGAHVGRSASVSRSAGVSRSRSVSRTSARGVTRTGARTRVANVNRTTVNRNVNRTTVNRNVNRAVAGGPGWRGGTWTRPGNFWWRPGGAVAAGAAIGFVTAATAVAWAGAAPAPGYCWYYTDASRTQGFWDACP